LSFTASKSLAAFCFVLAKYFRLGGSIFICSYSILTKALKLLNNIIAIKNGLKPLLL